MEDGWLRGQVNCLQHIALALILKSSIYPCFIWHLVILTTIIIFFHHWDHRQVFIGGAVLADVMKDKEEFWITKVFIIMMQIINLFSLMEMLDGIWKTTLLARPSTRRRGWRAWTSLAPAKIDLLEIFPLTIF